MELPLSDELYQRFSELLLKRAGLHYPERRRNDLAYGLSHAARSAGFEDLKSLADAVTISNQAWDNLIAELTIGETYFFRNAAHFAALHQLILPDLVMRRANTRNLRLWSAGCATGEEPYSLAITLGERLPEPERWQVSILATDINPRFLLRAREALYGAWSFRETPDPIRDRYFTTEGTRWRLRPELRRQVIFTQLNLAEAGYPSLMNGTVALDLIFCRNVTIYFDEATTRAVVQRFYESLAPGGWLVVGHAEPHTEIYRQFETHNVPGAVIYRKALDAPPFHKPVVQSQPIPPRPQALAPKMPMTPIAPVRPPTPVAPLFKPAPPPPAPEPKAPTPERIFAEAQAAADRGDWEVARKQAEALAVAQPLYGPIHFLLGQIHEQAGDLDAALTSYRRSVYLDPTLVMGILGMAHIWRHTGNRAEAQRAFRGALRQLERLNPDAVIPYAPEANVADLLAYVRKQITDLE